jgi:hypothetical protein
VCRPGRRYLTASHEYPRYWSSIAPLSSTPPTLPRSSPMAGLFVRVATQSCFASGPATTSCGGVRRRAAHPASLRPCRTIHSPAFGRFNATYGRVEKAFRPHPHPHPHVLRPLPHPWGKGRRVEIQMPHQSLSRRSLARDSPWRHGLLQILSWEMYSLAHPLPLIDPQRRQSRTTAFGRRADLYSDGSGGGIFVFRRQAVESAKPRSFKG